MLTKPEAKGAEEQIIALLQTIANRLEGERSALEVNIRVVRLATANVPERIAGVNPQRWRTILMNTHATQNVRIQKYRPNHSLDGFPLNGGTGTQSVFEDGPEICYRGEWWAQSDGAGNDFVVVEFSLVSPSYKFFPSF